LNNYKNIVFALFFLSAVLNAQSSYQVSLYGKINFCKITMGEAKKSKKLGFLTKTSKVSKKRS